MQRSRRSNANAEMKAGREAKQPSPQPSKRELRGSVNNRRAAPPPEPPVSESRERVTRRGARKENDKAVNKLLADAEVKKSEPVVQKEVDPDKLPFRGFDLEKEKPLLDLIERKSAVLFEQVRKLENLKVIEAAAAITAMKKSGAVTPPPGFIEGPVESAPKIQVVRVCGQDETFQDIVANLQKPFGAGWTRELVYKSVSDTKPEVVQYLSPDGTELKSLQEIKEYMENIYGVSDSSGGLTASGHFSFHKSPITNIDTDCGELMFVVDSAGKRRLVNGRQKRSPSKQPTTSTEVSVPPQVVKEDVGEAAKPITAPGAPAPPKQEKEGQVKQPCTGNEKPNKGGSQPPANAQQMKSNAAAAPGGVRRQRVQKSPIGAPGMNRQSEDDGMFTISAMHQANPMLVSGLEERRGQMQREREMLEEQNQFGNNMEDDEILPCSIRCPGMTGKVPTLQCKSCLCLYHGACLGFPPNAKFSNFICPNCDAKQNALPLNKPSMSQKVPIQMQRQRQMAKPVTQPVPNPMMTRRIGQTVISPEFQPIGKGGMSIKRMEIKPPELPGTRSRMAGRPLRGQLPPKKGMWSAAQIPIPPLSVGGKNVTITPMAKIPRGRAPPLPTLHPMLPNNSNSLAPPPIRPGRPGFGMPKLVRLGGARTVVPLPDLTRKRGASSGPQPPIPNNTQRRSLSLPQERSHMTKQWAASAGQFRRYPQSIVTIGNKRFIAMPRGQTDNNKNELDSAPEADSKVMDNGHELEEKHPGDSDTEAFVLEKIFPYLSVRDLLSASRVSQNWNKVASNKDLWKTVRMKNAHIFDYDGFATSLSQRETEILDLRKMAFENKLNWTALVESLTKIPSLKKVVFGTRSSPPSLIEMINERCPNVDVVV